VSNTGIRVVDRPSVISETPSVNDVARGKGTIVSIADDETETESVFVTVNV